MCQTISLTLLSLPLFDSSRRILFNPLKLLTGAASISRRRAKAREEYKATGVKADHTANFFDNDNASAAKAREGLAEECLENLIRWLKEEGGNVGIHDATNSTMARRKKLYDRVSKEPGLKIVFLESVCTDPKVIAANIAVKVASGDPDYDGIPKELAEKDFRARIKTYEENYQELGITPQEAKLSYCKIIDVGKQVIVNRIDGYLESRVAFCELAYHFPSVYIGPSNTTTPFADSFNPCLLFHFKIATIDTTSFDVLSLLPLYPSSPSTARNLASTTEQTS